MWNQLYKDIHLLYFIKMVLTIIDNNTIPSFYIEEYPLYKIENVQDVSDNLHPLLHKDNIAFNDKSFNWGWRVISDTTHIINNTPNYYFNIETVNQVSFNHWTIESAIHLFIFSKLKEMYPNIKIIIPIMKNYKRIFFNIFNLNETDIVSSYDKDNNIIIFPSYTNLHDPKSGELSYKRYLEHFINKVKKHINYDTIKKDISVLLFTRSKKENNCVTDRMLLNEDALIDLVQSIPNSMVYNPENTTDITTQLKLIARSHIIILEYGSSYFTNGLFSKNSNIIVLGVFFQNHVDGHRLNNELIVENNNSVTFTNTSTVAHQQIIVDINTINTIVSSILGKELL
jgi:hypothetical protein